MLDTLATVKQIPTSEMFTNDISVKLSDQYSKSVYLKFQKNFNTGSIHGCDEMFLTVDQLRELGEFFLNRADEISRELGA